jgi:hypothetical protein
VSLRDEITFRGDQVRGRLYELLQRHKYDSDTKTAVLVGYVAIALEHHKAIWSLSKLGLNGSAFALLRVMFDTYLRALWINKVATPEQMEQASCDELRFPKMRQIRADIEQAYFSTPDEQELTPEELAEAQRLRALGAKFFEFLKKVWRPLNSFTHSGGLQIGRRFTGDQVKANYSERDIVEALTLATTAVLLLLHMFFISTEHYDEVEEIHTALRQYRTDFNARLQVPKTEQ